MRSILMTLPLRFGQLLAAFCLTLGIQVAVQGVEYANLTVDAAGNVTIPSGQATSGFSITGNGSTGIIPIQIGASSTDDEAGGVLIGSIAENGRTVNLSTSGTETLYATSSVASDGSGGLNLVTRRAGADTTNSLFNGGALMDADLGAGYFPFADGWVGGTVVASGGAAFDTFNLNGMTAGNITQDEFGAGDNLVTIPGVVDTRRQGILLASHAANSNLYTLSTPTAGGDGFNLTTKANNTNGSAGTVGGAVSFVFVPRETPGLTMGRVHGGNSAHQASTAWQSGDAVTVAREGEALYRLSIAGQSPGTGTLLLAGHGSNDGAGGRASDNVVTYEASGNDWIVLHQDLANLTGDGQDTNEAEYYFDFAFLPFSGGPTGPGAVPAMSTLTNFNASRVLAWNAEVAELNPGNAPGDTLTTVPQSTSDVTVTPLGFNRGDNFYAVDGGFLAGSDGVMLATITDGLRDNTGTGGYIEYGVASTTFNNGEWQISTATSNASPGDSTEFNINHSVAFFGANSGFQSGIDQKVDQVTGVLDFTVSGVDPESNGVLFGNPATNEDNFLTITPQGAAGDGWDIALLDNSGELEQVLVPEGEDGFNYVYLPYEAENMIAGVAQADGSLISSTDTSDFSLSKVGIGEYKLTIPGKSPETGMLLLNATAEGDGDNSVVYDEHSDGSSFLIIGVDHVTVDEINNQFLLPNPEDTGFSFAYIDFEMPPSLAAPTPGDYDGDGDVDGDDLAQWQGDFGLNADSDGDDDGDSDGGDFVLWQRNAGTVPAGSANVAVPEPATVCLGCLAALATCLAGTQRRRS